MNLNKRKGIMIPDEQYACTPRAQQLLVFAERQAQLSGIDVRVEHIFIGFSDLGQSTGLDVLKSLNVGKTLFHMVRCTFGPPPHPENVDYSRSVLFTPRVKKILSLARKEARELGMPYIGTEHILLGIVSEGDSVPARFLKEVGVDYDKVKMKVLEINRLEVETVDVQSPVTFETAEPIGGLPNPKAGGEEHSIKPIPFSEVQEILWTDELDVRNALGEEAERHVRAIKEIVMSKANSFSDTPEYFEPSDVLEWLMNTNSEKVALAIWKLLRSKGTN